MGSDQVMLWLFSVKAASAAAGLELKCIITREEGVRLKVTTITYLLLSPRKLAFQLPVLIEQSLVFPTQSSKAFNKPPSKLCDVARSLCSHGVVSTRTGKWMVRSNRGQL